ncbi:hypothetical protein ABPG72_000175 [Tetrahymena utriculariae]
MDERMKERKLLTLPFLSSTYNKTVQINIFTKTSLEYFNFLVDIQNNITKQQFICHYLQNAALKLDSQFNNLPLYTQNIIQTNRLSTLSQFNRQSQRRFQIDLQTQIASVHTHTHTAQFSFKIKCKNSKKRQNLIQRYQSKLINQLVSQLVSQLDRQSQESSIQIISTVELKDQKPIQFQVFIYFVSCQILCLQFNHKQD